MKVPDELFLRIGIHVKAVIGHLEVFVTNSKVLGKSLWSLGSFPFSEVTGSGRNKACLSVVGRVMIWV